MYRTWLIPYLEGALSAGQRLELEARLADDPARAAALETLRPKLPQIRQAAQPAAIPPPGETPYLWPVLRERLEGTQPRRRQTARVWWLLGMALLCGLIASSVEKHHLNEAGRRADAKWHRELARAPRVVFYRNNDPGTLLASELQERAHKVAAEHLAAK